MDTDVTKKKVVDISDMGMSTEQFNIFSAVSRIISGKEGVIRQKDVVINNYSSMIKQYSGMKTNAVITAQVDSLKEKVKKMQEENDAEVAGLQRYYDIYNAFCDKYFK